MHLRQFCEVEIYQKLQISISPKKKELYNYVYSQNKGDLGINERSLVAMVYPSF